MRHTEQAWVWDQACRAIAAGRYTFPSEEERDTAATTDLATVSAVPGLLRYSLYRGLHEPTLIQLSQWSDARARDQHLQIERVPPSFAASTQAHVTCNWHHLCEEPHRTFVRAGAGLASCLVVVRQPLVRADPRAARGWIDAVIAALEDQSPEGLCAATFFVASGAEVVLNFAEWTSAAAHRAALKKAESGQYGSIGDSEAWRRARAHPAITREHEVGRYALVT